VKNDQQERVEYDAQNKQNKCHDRYKFQCDAINGWSNNWWVWGQKK